MRILSILFFVLIFSGSSYSQKLSRLEAEQDLHELDTVLTGSASYLKLKPFDYRGMIDSIILTLPEDSIELVDFAWRVRRLVGEMCDGHSNIEFSQRRMAFEPEGYLPFRVAHHLNKVVVLKDDDEEFYLEDFPYLKSINGVPVDRLKAEAGELQKNCSPARFHTQALYRLRYIEQVLGQCNALKGDTLEVLLTNGEKDSLVIDDISSHKRDDFEFPIELETELWDNELGYVRLEKMYYKDHESTEDAYEDVVYDMKHYLIPDAKGIIIDVRDNKGGGRHLIHKLLPMFLDKPSVLNVAVPKWDTKTFYKRYLYNIYDNEWTEEERAAVEEFRKTWEPGWDYPRDEFLDTTYYFVESPAKEKYHFDGPVVIVMNEICFSATDLFLGAMRQLDQVTLVGMPSSGGSGKRYARRLENSRLWVWISTMASFQPSGEIFDGEGVQPDVRVEQQLSDYIGESDTQLDAAVKILQEKIEEMESRKENKKEPKQDQPAKGRKKKKNKKKK